MLLDVWYAVQGRVLTCVEQIYSASFLTALAFYGTTSILILTAFCFIRPHHRQVYEARRSTSSALPSGPLEWLFITTRMKDDDVVKEAGLDAAVFLRFTRTMRNTFAILTVVAFASLLPSNILCAASSSAAGASFFSRMSPQYSSGSTTLWTYVAAAYLFDGLVCLLLWMDYRAVARLKATYLDSSAYQSNLFARTLLIANIPAHLQSDSGVRQLASRSNAAVIGRDVSGLKRDVKKHNDLVKGLNESEGENPGHVLSNVDRLRREIRDQRRSPESLKPESYGFASFSSVLEAHQEARQRRDTGLSGTRICLAVRPTDYIWRNLKLSSEQLRWRRYMSSFHIALLTVAWLVPNVVIAVFLSNVSHLALVWPSFSSTLHAQRTLWAIIQGIAPPAIISLFYFCLPIILRRLATNAGDITKSERERHVMHKLFSFYLFNQLFAFSLFSTCWAFGAALLHAARTNQWSAVVHGDGFEKITLALITVSPYWCCWLLQRNLGTLLICSGRDGMSLTVSVRIGSAVDLAQLLPLAISAFRHRFSKLAPAQANDVSIPTFDYAGHCSYYLFYAAVALAFGCLQPLALAVTAVYFAFDSVTKRYMLLYIFATKHESDGAYWHSLYNRMLINVFIGNVVIAMLVTAQGPPEQRWGMLAAMTPLPGLLALFKWHCARRFDESMRYHDRPQDDLSVVRKTHGENRFLHPAFTKSLAVIHPYSSDRLQRHASEETK